MSEPLTPAEAKAEARTATALFTFALLVVVLSVLASCSGACRRSA